MPDHAVVMACDAGYAPYAAVLAATIARHHPDRSFDICLCSQDQITLPAAFAGLGLRLIRLPAENPFAGGPHEDRHGAASYLRLMVPRLVAGQYRRLLYLDADILCAGPGLDRLLRIGMGDSWLAAVRDNLQWRSPTRHVAEFRALGFGTGAYFNSGMLLIDVEGWMRAEVESRALSLFRDHGAAMTRHDQSLLNVLARGHWSELSPVWNWQYTWSSRFFADLAEPRLVHFIGARKPWKDRGGALPARFRAPYAALAADWPGLPAPDMAGPEVAGWPPRLGRMFLKHWWAARRMRDYLARFPDPFTALPPG